MTVRTLHPKAALAIIAANSQNGAAIAVQSGTFKLYKLACALQGDNHGKRK